MSTNGRSWPWRVGAAIWRGLDRLRRFLHLLLLLFLFLIVVASLFGERVLVPRDVSGDLGPHPPGHLQHAAAQGF